MSKLGEVHDMAMNDKKAELIDWLEMRMSKGAARIGANEFMQAAKEIKEREGEPLFKNIEESDSTKL
jgi:hypothetical protein